MTKEGLEGVRDRLVIWLLVMLLFVRWLMSEKRGGG